MAEVDAVGDLAWELEVHFLPTDRTLGGIDRVGRWTPAEICLRTNLIRIGNVFQAAQNILTIGIRKRELLGLAVEQVVTVFIDEDADPVERAFARIANVVGILVFVGE